MYLLVYQQKKPQSFMALVEIVTDNLIVDCTIIHYYIMVCSTKARKIKQDLTSNGYNLKSNQLEVWI